MLAIKADYDGKKIVLPPKGNFPVGPVIVVFEETDAVKEREDWQRVSLAGLARAYGEGEPDYSLKLIREENAEYGDPGR